MASLGLNEHDELTDRLLSLIWHAFDKKNLPRM